MKGRHFLNATPRLALAAILVTSLFTTACVNVQSLSLVHKIDVPQGNILEQENINQLKPGMSKNQVRFLLGSPALVDPFHIERWDYLYRYKPGTGETTQKRITLHFENLKLARIEGDLHPQPIKDDASTKKTQVVVIPQVVKEDPGFIRRTLERVGLGE